LSTSPTRLTAKQAKRARKKERRDSAFVDGIRREELEAYIRTRIVCDRCGQEQSFSAAELLSDPSHPPRGRNMGWALPAEPTACSNCGSRGSAIFLDHYAERTGGPKPSR
jgi:hypothetical protein